MSQIERTLALGTAQLGMAYGVANVLGQPDEQAAHRIVSAAWAAGVRYFDTAQAYEASEAVLGRALACLPDRERAAVITKLAPDSDVASPRAIRESLLRSREKLGVAQLWAVLLHREQMLDAWNGALGDALRAARDEGIVARLGVSVYAPERALMALEQADLDVLQVPASVFDRRMVRAGVFRRAMARRKQVFVRSVYLQGLALMSPDALPPRMAFARAAVGAFAAYCRERGCDRAGLAVAYMLRSAPEASLVIGAETAAQMQANVTLVASGPAGSADVAAWDRSWPDDIPELIDPSRWPAAA